MEVIAVRHGSVKDVEIFKEASSTALGLGDMRFKPTYSIFDLKKMPDEIPGREALCVIAAFDCELVENAGIRTHYEGVVNRDGEAVPLDHMHEPPTRMRVRLATIHEPEVIVAHGNLVFSYGLFEGNRNNLNNFVIPVEWIYRNGLPQGSSVLRELARAKERGDTAYVERQLKKLGLAEMPAPNTMLPRPYGNFTTKYEPLGDRSLGDDYDLLEAMQTGDYSKSEAVRISGLTLEQFGEVKAVRDEIARIIKRRGEETGITTWDGKLEFAWADGPMAVDVIGGPDEDRWFYDDQQVSKEVSRQLYDAVQPDLRTGIDRAQKLAAEEAVRTGKLRNWRDYMQIHPVSMATLSQYIIPLLGEMHMALANQWTGIHFYKARHLKIVMKDLNDAVADVTARYRG